MSRVVFIAVAALLVASRANAVVTGTTFIANAGESVLFAAADPTDADRMFLAARDGDIRVLDLSTGTIDPTPFLTIPSVNTLGSEGGLLGLALHPDYANNGLGYVHYTTAGGRFRAGVSRIASFQRDPTDPTQGLADSVTQLLSFDQPQGNHNAGWIGFSPNDGYLYIASGDGGGSDDNDFGHTAGTGNSLDITDNLLGKMLRIDVNGDDFPDDAARNYAIPSDNPFVGVTGDDEIWTYGLRNPFRNGFDRETGDLWIADVGQNTREEINFQPADSVGGENYGWRLREGSVATPSGGVGGAAPPGAVDPVYEYFHGGGALRGNSVTGGTVYRGPDASLDGLYFFADFQSSNYWTFDPADPSGTVQNINSQLAAGSSDNNPVAFVEDLVGNLYILTIGGNILRIDTTPPGDYDGDGLLTAEDLQVWQSAFGDANQLDADGNGDGRVDAADYTVWRDAFASPASATPEPSSAVSLTIAAFVAAWSRRRDA